MKISSISTFVLPLIALGSSAYIFFSFFYGIGLFSDSPFFFVPVLMIALYVSYKFLFKRLFDLIDYSYWVLLLFGVVSAVVFFIYESIVRTYPVHFLEAFILGAFLTILLFAPFSIMRNRHFATLEGDKIIYYTLFGEKDFFNVQNIVVIEQKRNVLAVFRQFRFLDFFVQTDITFRDENLDEYMISIYPRLFNKRNYTFNLIVETAEKYGNESIRQYVV